MDLEQAGRIVAEQDISDPARTLEALAAVLRFHGISDTRFIGIAESLEAVAGELQDGSKASGEK